MFSGFTSKKSAGFLALSVAALALIYQRWSQRSVFEDKPKPYYDYIIVGGGTAGSLLARRLSEHPTIQVLLVEAGHEEPWLSSIPFLAPALQMTSTDWGFQTTPQRKALLGFKDQQANWPRGRALGGSSAINSLVHSWGTREDYDSWKEGFGCQGWDYESVKKYFLRQESFRSAQGSTKGHRGSNGPLPVSEFDINKSPIAKAFVKACTEMGFEEGDLNGEKDEAIMPSQSNIDGGRRWSAYKSFLKPVIDRPNIDVIIDSFVTRVTVEGRTAVGIEMIKVHTGDVFYVQASEVILSAGAIGTPNLLMHSGIGDRQVLDKAGIPVIAHVPGVGKNLQDHLNVPVYFHLREPYSNNIAKAKSFKQIAKYFIYGEGIFGWNGVEAWARTSMRDHSQSQNNTNTSFSLPSDVVLFLLNMGSVQKDMYAKIVNLKEEAFLASFPDTHNESKEGFIILSFCSHPRSKGEISVLSSDPFEHPQINPRYLEDPYDVNCTVKAIKLAARLASVKPLASLGARIHFPDYEECSQYQKSLHDIRYLQCWVKVAAMTTYHPTGTCKMGRDEDPLAVVDTELRVRGIKNLRVVDASVFPRILSGPLHSGVLMVADKAADVILHSRIFKDEQIPSKVTKKEILLF